MMPKPVSIILPVLLSLAILPSTVMASDGPPDGMRPPEPPPEAFTACADKKAGDKVVVKGPRGEEITAVCREHGDRLAAMPDGPPPPPRQ